MNTLLSPVQGYILLAGFGLFMFLLTYAAGGRARDQNGVGFLVAGRKLGWGIGSLSIAASWIWAPALFVSVQKSYELGLAGLFWFTAPNICALAIFAILAPKIRSTLPDGYTLPDWIRYRFPESPALHRLYLVPYVWYQVMAITVQIFVGGLMLQFLTGMDLNLLMVLLLAVGLSYSLLGGLRASVLTDVVQMVFIVLGCGLVIPMVIWKVGLNTVREGFAGIAGSANILDPKIAFSFGIVTSIGLISGAISDQQYWQRSFAIKRSAVVKSFIFGGLLFGVVPVALSVLGFIAAVPRMGISLPGEVGLPMIGVAAVAELLPTWTALVFVLMLLSGLSSTLDSAMCAAGSLYAIDIAPLDDEERVALHGEGASGASLSDKVTRRARFAMVAIALIGLAVAFVVEHLFSLDRLWWIFNGVAVCFVVPTVMSLYYSRLSSRGAISGICMSLLGMVVFVYGNWIQNDKITVGSTVFILVASALCCALFRQRDV